MKYLPANPVRGAFGVVATIFMISGAGLLWGTGGALFVGGLFFAIDASIDEAIERFTNTARSSDVGKPAHD